MEPTTRVKRVTAAVAYWPPITQQGAVWNRGSQRRGRSRSSSAMLSIEPLLHRDAKDTHIAQSPSPSHQVSTSASRRIAVIS